MVDKLRIDVRQASPHLWVADAPSVRVSETGESYLVALDRLRSRLEDVLDKDVELDVYVTMEDV